jgi:WD40 repeat protein/tetratricopeptide (TPR) repeat protein
LDLRPDGRFLAALHYSTSGDRSDDWQFRVWDLQTKTMLDAIPSNISGKAWAFDPNDDRLFLGLPDGSVAVWDLESVEEITRVAVGAWFGYMAYDADRDRLALGVPEPPEVRVVDMASQQVVLRLPHPDEVLGVAWQPGTDRLAAASGSDVFVWNLADPAADPQRLEEHHQRVEFVAYHPSGNLLASYDWDGRVWLWNARTGEPLVHSPGASCLRFSADGDRLLGANVDSRVGVFQVAAGRELTEFAGHCKAVAAFSVDFDPSGHWLASASFDGVRLWDLSSREGKDTLVTQRSSGFCRFLSNPPGLLASTRFGLLFWPVRSIATADSPAIGPPGKIALPDLNFANPFAVSRDGKTLATLQSADGTGRIIALDDPKRAVWLEDASQQSDIAIHPQSVWVAGGGKPQQAGRIWDAASGRIVAELEENCSVQFSPDGRWLVTGTRGEYRFRNVPSWQVVHAVPRQYTDLPGPVAFADDGSVVAIAKSPAEIALLDPVTAEEFAVLRMPALGMITGLGVGCNGTRLAATSRDGVVLVWRLGAIGRQLTEWGVAASPHWHRLAMREPPAENASAARAVATTDMPDSWYPPAMPRYREPEITWQPATVYEARRYREEVEQFTARIAKEPNSIDHHWGRGYAHARQAEWAQAETDFRTAVELGCQNVALWRYLALLHLACGDRDAYRSTCRDAMNRFGDTEDLYVADFTARLCTTAVDGLEDYAEALRLTEAIAAQSERHCFLRTRALVLYRQRHFDSAATVMSRCVELQDGAGKPSDWLLMAMIQYQLGQRDEAERWFKRARIWLDAPPRVSEWDERLECSLWLREAESAQEETPRPIEPEREP